VYCHYNLSNFVSFRKLMSRRKERATRWVVAIVREAEKELDKEIREETEDEIEIVAELLEPSVG